jgi:hypothetical protein
MYLGLPQQGLDFSQSQEMARIIGTVTTSYHLELLTNT